MNGGRVWQRAISVAWILSPGGVHHHDVGGNGEDGGEAALLTTELRAVGVGLGEDAEADHVVAPPAFPCQLNHTLVEDVLQSGFG